jgi:CTP synthase
MQCAAIEYARNVCGLTRANSSEFDEESPDPVIALMAEQKDISDMGGTMRLGAYPCRLQKDTKAHEAYGELNISERHRHRYEFNNAYREVFQDKGMQFSGLSPNGTLVEIMELNDHPWFVGGQFHPELKSRINKAHPLFREFVRAALKYSQSQDTNGSAVSGNVEKETLKPKEKPAKK